MYGSATNSLIVQGQIPDSIYVMGWASTDTLSGMLTFKAAPTVGTGYTYTALDTLKSKAQKTLVVPRSAYIGAELIGASFKQFSSGASVLAANNKVWVRMRLIYRIR